MLLLKYTTGPTFAKKFDEYIKNATTRAVPSLFSAVKPLYADSAKVALIEDVVTKHIDSLRSKTCFSDTQDTEQDPTALLWILLFAAQHFDAKKDFKRALELIEETIQHTPTLVEAHTIKARIHKHMGDPVKALESYEQGRILDQADRYLNARCSKYLIRAGKTEEAERMMALFAKEVNGELNVHDMQCMWYELEMGTAFEKKGALAKAYKMFKYVDQHFATVYDDQV
ncbi:MAG: hypothetical protein P4M11_04870 [Candidatus Pacebacteria bacterium]|nr:hypothetical protein [Candidatus Paceibacterota bacterium]